MTKKQIFISSVQSEFAEERKRLAEYIRQDALFSRYFETFLFEDKRDGLHKPEFIQDDDFLTILWRLMKDDAAVVTDHVTDHVAGHVTGNVAGHVTTFGGKVTELDGEGNRARLTAKQRKVLEFCDETPHTAREIIEMIGVKCHTRTVEQYHQWLKDHFEVHEALQKANESVNKLGLVPVSL